MTADEKAAAAVPVADYDAARTSEVLRHLHRHQHGAGNIRAHEAGRHCPELDWHYTLAVPAISTYVGLPLLPASDQAFAWPLDPDNRTGTVVYLQSGQRHGEHGQQIRYWLPWGNTGRLMLAWLGGQALIAGDRQLHTRDLYAFLAGNGIKVGPLDSYAAQFGVLVSKPTGPLHCEDHADDLPHDPSGVQTDSTTRVDAPAVFHR